jgi:hypothetical protein
VCEREREKHQALSGRYLVRPKRKRHSQIIRARCFEARAEGEPEFWQCLVPRALPFVESDGWILQHECAKLIARWVLRMIIHTKGNYVFFIISLHVHVKTHCIEAYNVHAHRGTLHELRWLALTLSKRVLNQISHRWFNSKSLFCFLVVLGLGILVY